MSISSHKSPSPIIIIGAGPAGMSSALAGIRAGHKVIVIDMGENDGSYYHVQGTTHFEKGAGGILGIDNFWGAQLIYPTERDIQNFRNLAGDYVVDEILSGVQEIQDFLKLEIHKDNKYPEVDFSISDQLPHQFRLIHSKFLPNCKLIKY